MNFFQHTYLDPAWISSNDKFGAIPLQHDPLKLEINISKPKNWASFFRVPIIRAGMLDANVSYTIQIKIKSNTQNGDTAFMITDGRSTTGIKIKEHGQFECYDANFSNAGLSKPIEINNTSGVFHDPNGGNDLTDVNFRFSTTATIVEANSNRGNGSHLIGKSGHILQPHIGLFLDMYGFGNLQEYELFYVEVWIMENSI